MNRQTRSRLTAAQVAAKAALLAQPPSEAERAFLAEWRGDRTCDGLLPPPDDEFDEPTAREVYAELVCGLWREWPAPCPADFVAGGWQRFQRLSETA